MFILQYDGTESKDFHGGKRKGAGRKPGSLNKRTVALRDISDEALFAGLLPLQVMLQNMRFYDKRSPQA